MKKNLMLVIVGLIYINTYATTRYVSQDSTGAGTSWADASGDLQLMINQSSMGDTIWISKGIYFPIRQATALSTISLNNRDNAFVIGDSLFVFGSFHGNETSLSQRTDSVIDSNRTVLSGDLGTLNDSTDNAYHDLICTGNKIITLDGLIIEQANADGGSTTITVNSTTIWRDDDAGIYGAANIHLNNAIVRNNRCGNVGAGASVGGLSVISNTIFENNLVLAAGAGRSPGGTFWGGAGLAMYAGCKVINCKFIGNKGEKGGAIGIFAATGSDVILTNVLLSGNISSVSGGAIYNLNSTPVLTNVTISANQSPQGGGIYNSNASADPKIRNSIIYGNSSDIGGSNADTSNIFYSLVGGITNNNPIKGNISGSTNPLFVNQLPPGLSAGGDYHLQATSTLINKGSNNYYATTAIPDISSITTDLDKNQRIINCTVDMGAYEYVLPGQFHLSLGSDTTVCPGTSISLDAGSNFNSYLWNTGDTTQMITISDSGYYNVEVTDTFGCTSKDTVHIAFYPQPQANLIDTTFICQGDTASLLAGSGNSSYSYLWSTGDTTSQIETNQTGSYWVTVTDSNGCSSSDTEQVVQYPSSSIVITGDTLIQSGESDVLTANGADTYIWTTGSTSDTTVVSPTQTTTYTVVGTDTTTGCRVSSSFTVNIEVEIHFAIGVPSAFSPNGDGINDILYVRGGGVKTLQFLIYNRYGQKVFESDDMNTGWDGTMQGKKLNPGVFVYYVKAVFTDNSIKKIKGNVTLVK